MRDWTKTPDGQWANPSGKTLEYDKEKEALVACVSDEIGHTLFVHLDTLCKILLEAGYETRPVAEFDAFRIAMEQAQDEIVNLQNDYADIKQEYATYRKEAKSVAILKDTMERDLKAAIKIIEVDTIAINRLEKELREAREGKVYVVRDDAVTQVTGASEQAVGVSRSGSGK